MAGGINILSFIVGWASCAAFMFVVQTAIWLRDRRQVLARLDAERAVSLTEMICPWPMREHELAARPDWVEKFNLHSVSVSQGGQQDNV